MQRLLHAWRLTAIASGQPAYYEEIDAVRSGTARTTPADQAIVGWQDLLITGTGREPVIYRADLSDRVLGQLGDFPAKAFDALMAPIPRRRLPTRWTPRDLTLISGARQATAAGSPVLPLLKLLQVRLEHRFGADVSIGTAAQALAHQDEVAL